MLKRRVDGGFLRRSWGSTYASQYGYLLPLRPHSSPRCLPGPPAGTPSVLPGGEGPTLSRYPTEAMPFVYTTNLSEVRGPGGNAGQAAGLAGGPHRRLRDRGQRGRRQHGPARPVAGVDGDLERADGEIICEMRDGGRDHRPVGWDRQPPAADGQRRPRPLACATRSATSVDLQLRRERARSSGCTWRCCRGPHDGRVRAAGTAAGVGVRRCSLGDEPCLYQKLTANRMHTHGSWRFSASAWRRSCATTTTRSSAAGASWSWRACAAGPRPRKCGVSSTTSTRSSSGSLSGADDHAAGELRAALDELSRSRARNGFTPSETALGGVRAQGCRLRAGRRRRRPGARVPRVLAPDRRPRPAHLRGLLGRPGADHRRPGHRDAGAVHAGRAAVGRHHRGAAGRHARLGPHPAGHGEAARDPGGDRAPTTP